MENLILWFLACWAAGLILVLAGWITERLQRGNR